MTNLVVPSRTSYVVNIETGTKIEGTFTITRKQVTIEPVKSDISEVATEVTNADGSLAAFPRVN